MNIQELIDVFKEIWEFRAYPYTPALRVYRDRTEYEQPEQNERELIYKQSDAFAGLPEQIADIIVGVWDTDIDTGDIIIWVE